MAGVSTRKLTVDLNLLFDLAEGEEFALEFLTVLQAHGFAFILPPTVSGELGLIASSQQHPSHQLALKSLTKLLGWKISPANLVGVGHGITEQFARLLIKRKLLPEAEFNDGLILAEASLLGTAGLVSSDEHLWGINEPDLKLAFIERDLQPVSIFRPRELYRGIMRIQRRSPRS